QEADHVAAERLDSRWPVPGGRAGDQELRAARALDRRGLERRESLAVSLEPRGARGGRERGLRPVEKRPPAAVEIVGMLVVAEQRRIDRAHLLGRERRPRGLPQEHASLVFAWRVESGIGQESHAVEFDENRRSADEGQRRFETVHEDLRPAIVTVSAAVWTSFRLSLLSRASRGRREQGLAR